jgi:hypothetical protein
MSKINVRNVVLVIGVSIFDILAGFYDRFVNGIGIIRWVGGQVSFLSSITQQPTEFSMNQAISAINPISLIVFVVLGILVILLLGCTCGYAGRD